MSNRLKITILGKVIPTIYEEISIEKLNYSKENPRVISTVQFIDDRLTDAEVQGKIHTEMIKQPSVISLKTTIVDHGGLQEPILVRADRNEVIEGNSRLAAFRELYKDSKNQEEKWERIPCLVISELSPDQQYAYLNQIHVIGKTGWAAYEKANMTYNHYKKGKTAAEIAKLSSTNESEILKRIEVIELMKENNDNTKENFSYYNDCLVRNRVISSAREDDPELNRFLLNTIKKDAKGFTALDLRNKLPRIIESKKKRKKNPLTKFITGEMTLEKTYSLIALTTPSKKVKDALQNIKDIKVGDIKNLKNQDLNKLEIDVKRLKNAFDRLVNMINSKNVN